MMLILLLLLAQESPPRETMVGRPLRTDPIVIDGTELIVKANPDPKTPVALRILRADKHGSAFRYVFEVVGFEAGEFDIARYLVRADGSEWFGVPRIPVNVSATAPPTLMEPADVPTLPVPRVGGYFYASIAAFAIWLMILLFFWRRSRPKKPVSIPAAKPVAFVDQLVPLIEKVLSPDRTSVDWSALEQTLLIYWRRRLELTDLSPSESMLALRAHPVAGDLLAQLEAGLHKPDPKPALDWNRLLEPYRTVADPVARSPLAGEVISP